MAGFIGGPVDDLGNPTFHIDAPSEHDGKPVMVISPATEGTMTWITSHGDDMNPTPPATGRGEGTQLTLSFTEPASKSVQFQFSQPTELHDGQIWYTPVDNWSNADNFSFAVTIPANTVVENAGGTGNCNLVEIVPGTGMSIIVPAAGDGAYDIDLDTAKPCFMPGNTGGYWDIDWLDGTILMADPELLGTTKWGMFNFEVKSYFIKRVAMGNPLGVFDIDVYKAEWCHQSWVFELSCERVSAGAADVGGWLMLFRKDST